MKARSLFLLGLVLAPMATGCKASANAGVGASSPSPPPPPPPTPASPPAAVAPGREEAPSSTEKGAPSKSRDADPADMSVRPDFGQAEVAFASSVDALKLALGSATCSAACRALASMDRAAKNLCELARGSQEQQRCETARGKLREARTRVRATCGECQGGPTTDPDAP